MTPEPSTNVIVGVYRPPTLAGNKDEPEVLFIKYRYQKRGLMPVRNPKAVNEKIPGGGKHRIETIRAAGVRELKTETGLRPLDRIEMPEIFLGEVPRQNYVERKYGLLVRRSECNGRLHKQPVVENKTTIFGYDWKPLSAAIEHRKPGPNTRDTSQYDFLIEVRKLLIERGEYLAHKAPKS